MKEDVSEDTNLPSSATGERYEILLLFLPILADWTHFIGVHPLGFITVTGPHSRITSVFAFITSVDTIEESEGGEAGVQQASPTPETPVSAAAETGKKQKPWWRRWLSSRHKVCSTEL